MLRVRCYIWEFDDIVMNINRVSIYRKTILMTVILIISLFLLVYFLSIGTIFVYVATPWLIVCIIVIITNLSLYDIRQSGDVLFFTKILNKKEINLLSLKIYKITIRMHPYFFLETSAGNFNINYTKQNFQQLLELLRMKNFTGLNLFELKVNRYIIYPG